MAEKISYVCEFIIKHFNGRYCSSQMHGAASASETPREAEKEREGGRRRERGRVSVCVCVYVLSSSELQCRQIATLKKLTAKFVCISLFPSLSLACALSFTLLHAFSQCV